MRCNLEQLTNAKLLITVTPLPIVTLVSPEQLLNAEAAIELTLSGIVTVVNQLLGFFSLDIYLEVVSYAVHSTIRDINSILMNLRLLSYKDTHFSKEEDRKSLFRVYKQILSKITSMR